MNSILLKIYTLIFGSRVLLQQILKNQQDEIALLQQVINLLTPGPAVKFIFTAVLENGTIKENSIMETMRDDQKMTLAVKAVDAKGFPALVDGVPTWASSDETVVTVVPAADGMSGEVTAVAPGTARVVVTGDADLGAGVTPITGIDDFTITGGGAASFQVTGSAPVSQ